MLAAIAEALTGPKPGMVIRRCAISSPRAIASMVRLSDLRVLIGGSRPHAPANARI
jgi:hypothetical protein